MHFINKTIFSALLALSALGLFTSQLAVADGASDAAVYCTGCHDGLTVNGVAIGGGARSCPQRTIAEWTSTIDRMNGKGCGVPAGSIAGMASYLAGLGSTTTSTTTSTTLQGQLMCYRALDGTSYTTTYSSCPYPDGPTPPPTYGCPGTNRAYIGNSWACEGTTTTTRTSSTSTSTTSTTTTTLYGDPFGYDMGIIITSSSTYLLPDAPDSYGVSYSATITNYGPGPGVADIHLQMTPDRVWSGSFTANCVRYLDGCRATLAAGEQATVAASSYVRLDSNLSLNLSLTDVGGDSRFEENSANNSASISFTPPVPPPTTRTCYDQSGNPFTVSGWCPLGSTANPPPTCAIGSSPYLGYVGGGVWSWSCVATTTTSSTIPTVTSTTTTTTGLTCYKPSADGLSYITEVSYLGFCSSGWAYSPPPPCPGGTLSIVQNHMWQCTVATSSTTSSTTTSSTTTTTLCNTYVNGTSQHPYSGSGSCHGHSDDRTTTGHIVRDQKWCRKHMTHFNSSGNHTHAYPHPVCM